ncbi:choline TMA-lyase-activating enzyme [Desulfovibrio sp.]|uniref:choline TMA-lyase-activating enzyme n=1 Tax=Desulfovibrio sp. TaxID=885 RepID=UPI0023C24876|nr:choline TMA-lyase-activating enzyme [Desulfovibrio sp.]MDE7240605.1 choline TMA-lyase-activating enzyme [Desulfovibrio sp.]
MDARIFNIQKYSIYDGPGIRTLVFFQGCPLRCLWCSNPEGKEARSRIMWNAGFCAHCGRCVAACAQGLHAIAGSPPRHEFREEAGEGRCEGCGACANACPERALALSGRRMSIDEIMAVVLEDRVFYQTSGGGLTLGGGEPLAQPEAAVALLTKAKAEGISTAVETCGHVPADTVARVAPLADLFLYDIKHMDSGRHKELTGRDNTVILENLKSLLASGAQVRVRMPLISGCNADLEEMRARAGFLQAWRDAPGFRGVDLLPYHKLGVHKYTQLGESYSLDEAAAVPAEFLEQAKALFEAAGLPVAVVRH